MEQFFQKLQLWKPFTWFRNNPVHHAPGMIVFTPEQREKVSHGDVPVSAVDPDTNREYVVVPKEMYEDIKKEVLIEVDPSFFEHDVIEPNEVSSAN